MSTVIGPRFEKGRQILAKDLNAVARLAERPGIGAGGFEDRASVLRRRLAVAAVADDTVRVKNNTLVDCEQFSVMGVQGFVTDPAVNEPEFLDEVALSCVAPIVAGSAVSPALHTEDSLVILAEPIKAGGIGRAWVSGECIVRVRVFSDFHRFAGAVNNQVAYVQSLAYGPLVILWRQPGPTGVKWAVVRWGGSFQSIFPVKLLRVGGTQGTAENAASWTYDVKDFITDAVIATAVSPTASPHKWVRPSLGQMTQATLGYAHYQSALGVSQLVLGWINETAIVEACPDV